MVGLLLDKGADINATGNRGSTILSTAVRTNNSLMVKELLEREANANARDNDGSTCERSVGTVFQLPNLDAIYSRDEEEREEGGALSNVVCVRARSTHC
jgi:ankyrin repeat protein